MQNTTKRPRSPYYDSPRRKLNVTWYSMIKRCTNARYHTYKHYGGRGIKVCERWMVFDNFYEDLVGSMVEHLKNNTSRNTTLDRINNDGNYELTNCRWATQKENVSNKRNNVMIAFNGEILTLMQWSDKTGLGFECLKKRIFKYGFSLEEAFALPSKRDPWRRNSRGISS